MKTESSRRRIELNLPLVGNSTITRRRFLASTGVILTWPAFRAAAADTEAAGGTVQAPNTKAQPGVAGTQ